MGYAALDLLGRHLHYPGMCILEPRAHGLHCIAGELREASHQARPDQDDTLHHRVCARRIARPTARTSPEHKLRIVRALQANGHIVAMTGDGVNDAPSLRQADVGTAMGIKGTEASKEAAEMVLLDDNFASIVNAVSEGRTVHDNIRKVISWEIPTNGAETLAVVLAILVGFSLPMSATQILWVNLILASTLGLCSPSSRPSPASCAVDRGRPRRRCSRPSCSGEW
ncbi:ATPase, P-type (transporting), HAD superfamily, subfamily IC [Microvirga guangxiensis]|uniref:ATPase, P-type (Transporting), HAD superfamily, subfamily IC n=1 Tax=Microvirga guangxiensis TaxID=549386 RepID=A0A1G5KA88_9HYPH|nr:ATPase, P-type (transporting), HAD superfamily, subfamily IC [Microvirga guangxiensis]